MPLLILETLGFLAGLTNLASSLPQLRANLCDRQLAAHQSAMRNALQCAGNTLWLAYGLSVGSVAMTTFSTLGTMMAALLLFQVVRARRVFQQSRTPTWQTRIAR